MKNKIKTEEQVKSYTSKRMEIINILDHTPVRVLDIGCSDGANGAMLIEHFRKVKVYGIERDEEFVNIARTRLTSVMQADLEQLVIEQLPSNIDLFIFMDVLEHLINPRETFKKIIDKSAAEDNVFVIISLPNVQHITVIKNLLLGVWPERDRGIFDRTHLRWFTLKSIKNFAKESGFKIEKIERSFRLYDKPSGILNRMAFIFKYTPLSAFFTYQYIILLKK